MANQAGHICNQGERLAKIESGIESLQRGHDSNNRLLVDIDKKLFKGNGAPALSVAVDRNTRANKAIIWVGSVIGTAVIVQSVYLIFELVGAK